MSDFQNRVIRAISLDASLYREVEEDRNALGQAMGVVVLSSIAGGIGSGGLGGITGLAAGIIASLLGWFVWAYITYLVGTKLLPEPRTRADHGELLRTIGFASAPGFFHILGIIPLLGVLISLAVSIWMFIAMVIAVRQALDYTSTLRAVAVCIIGWIPYLIAIAIIGALFGNLAVI